MTYLELKQRLAELLLMRVDKMTMATSVEARVPFLDHELVEFALSIPQKTKTDGGTLKPVLKLAVRGLVPDEVIDRPKQGFKVPVEEWLLARLGDTVRRELDAFCTETDLLDRGEVRRLVERRSRETWTLLNLAMWYREFIA